jgi:hypothetical protein
MVLYALKAFLAYSRVQMSRLNEPTASLDSHYVADVSRHQLVRSASVGRHDRKHRQ